MAHKKPFCKYGHVLNDDTRRDGGGCKTCETLRKYKEYWTKPNPRRAQVCLCGHVRRLHEDGHECWHKDSSGEWNCVCVKFRPDPNTQMDLTFSSSIRTGVRR